MGAGRGQRGASARDARTYDLRADDPRTGRPQQAPRREARYAEEPYYADDPRAGSAVGGHEEALDLGWPEGGERGGRASDPHQGHGYEPRFDSYAKAYQGQRGEERYHTDPHLGDPRMAAPAEPATSGRGAFRQDPYQGQQGYEDPRTGRPVRAAVERGYEDPRGYQEPGLGEPAGMGHHDPYQADPRTAQRGYDPRGHADPHGHPGGAHGHEAGYQADPYYREPMHGGGAGHHDPRGYDPRYQADATGYGQAGGGADPYGEPAPHGYDPHYREGGQGGHADPYANPQDGYGDYGHGYQQGEQWQGQEHGADGYAAAGYDEEPHPATYEEPAPRGRRALIVVGALAGAVLIGGGLGFVYKLTSGEKTASGKPAVVVADKRPVKKQPDETGEKAFDSSGKSIYERLGSEEQGASEEAGTTVVASEEAAVDRGGDDVEGIPGISLSSGGSLLEPAATTRKKKAAASVASAGDDVEAAAAGSPRKVTPVLVKPGETITDDSEPIPAATSLSSGVSVESVATTARAAKKKSADAAEQIEADLAQTLKGSADSDAEPVVAPAKKKVASVEPTTPAVSASTGGSAGGVSGYVVQVRASTSRIDALGAFADMQQRYGSVMAGGQPDIQEVEKSGTMWYRLRIGPPSSKSAAASLCANLKKAGLKDCIVTSY